MCFLSKAVSAQTEEDSVVSINGTDVVFPAGTYYGEIVQAQLDVDEFPVVVWNPDADDINGSGDGYGDWYNLYEWYCAGLRRLSDQVPGYLLIGMRFA